MAYLVLALGAFLSIGGALSIFHGAGIVEIERGWTGVIAGATSLTGGIITIALGLILKTLLELRPALSNRIAAPRVAADGVIAHGFDARAAAEPAIAPPVGEPTSLMTAELESDMLAAILSPSESAIEAERPFGAPTEHPKKRALPLAEAFEPARNELPVYEHNVPEAEEDPAVISAPQTEVIAEKSRFKINFKRQPPASLPPEPAPIVVVEAEAKAPAMDDWLDRAFSALDNEPPLGAPVGPRHQPDAAGEHEDTLVHAQTLLETAPEPVAKPEPSQHEPASSSPTPTSAVIGRYEADGTSYVMYADGSIEAQSDAGVYRFNSMTELKAFIESSET